MIQLQSGSLNMQFELLLVWHVKRSTSEVKTVSSQLEQDRDVKTDRCSETQCSQERLDDTTKTKQYISEIWDTLMMFTWTFSYPHSLNHLLNLNGRFSDGGFAAILSEVCLCLWLFSRVSDLSLMIQFYLCSNYWVWVDRGWAGSGRVVSVITRYLQDVITV